jgi:hypothetical protein
MEVETLLELVDHERMQPVDVDPTDDSPVRPRFGQKDVEVCDLANLTPLRAVVNAANGYLARRRWRIHVRDVFDAWSRTGSWSPVPGLRSAQTRHPQRAPHEPSHLAGYGAEAANRVFPLGSLCV